MDAKTKKYLIIGGVATVVLALAGFGVHKFIKNRKNRTTSGKQKEREEQKLIGKKVHYGSEGYVNVRSSAKVDNENWTTMAFSHNLLTQAESNPVGTILERLKGEDGYYWYRIKLTKTVGGKAEGYVREDAVVVQY